MAPTALLLSGNERGFGQITAVLVPLELALNAVYNAGQASCETGRGQGGGLLPDLLCGGAAVRRSRASGPSPSCRGSSPAPSRPWCSSRTMRPVRILLPAEPRPAGPARAFPDEEHRGPQEALRRGTRRRGPPSPVPALTG
ncbi:hypothetical protein P3T27_005970 [Kitasatospora sp. MAA19]|uniref:hypothetical protein n=1 Tax=unclassified Kitasatospora TaxID=2633591 RepID=UPI002474F5D7|nr:hypothetical protein [Kitasatospora sp. MAA19]MDH6709224.1 hypothetical protein [Kitasatospora sp. MAA19]